MAEQPPTLPPVLEGVDGQLASTSSAAGPSRTKPKLKRASNACRGCRVVKAKCVGLGQAGPCDRCRKLGVECEVIPSKRGKGPRRKPVSSSQFESVNSALQAVLNGVGEDERARLVLLIEQQQREQRAKDSLADEDEDDEDDESNDVPVAGPSSSAAANVGPTFAPTDWSSWQSGPPSLASQVGTMLSQPVWSTATPMPNPAPLPPQASSPKTALTMQPHTIIPAVSPQARVASNASDAASPSVQLDQAPLDMLAEVSRARRDGLLKAPSTSSKAPQRYEVFALVDESTRRELVHIFMSRMNTHSCILHPGYHTLERITARSELLLTTICAVASKFLPSTASLHTRLLALATKLTFCEPSPRWRAIETIQAFLLLTIWGRRGEALDSHTLFYALGNACRIALDMNLHLKVPRASLVGEVEPHEVDDELINRERTWLMLWAIDRSTSAQRNRPCTLPELGPVSDWGWQAEEDRRVVAYVQLQAVASRFNTLFRAQAAGDSSTLAVATLSGPVFASIQQGFEVQLRAWHGTWSRRSSYRASFTDERFSEQKSHVDFYFNYNLLLLSAYGLQHALDKSPADVMERYLVCHQAASQVVSIAHHRITDIRYSPDAHFLFASYAAAFLLKLAHLPSVSTDAVRKEAIDTVRAFAGYLGSVAIGPSHTPALYSVSLEALVSQFELRTAEAKAAEAASRANNVNGAWVPPQPPAFEPSDDLVHLFGTPRHSRAGSVDWTQIFDPQSFLFDFPNVLPDAIVDPTLMPPP